MPACHHVLWHHNCASVCGYLGSHGIPIHHLSWCPLFMLSSSDDMFVSCKARGQAEIKRKAQPVGRPRPLLGQWAGTSWLDPSHRAVNKRASPASKEKLTSRWYRARPPADFCRPAMDPSGAAPPPISRKNLGVYGINRGVGPPCRPAQKSQQPTITRMRAALDACSTAKMTTRGLA